MADILQTETQTADFEQQNESSCSFELVSLSGDEICQRLEEISHLVMTARIQAREASIRAKYASEFARKAVGEAASVDEVSLSLAKTSRIVAALALEFTNKMDQYLEKCYDGDYSDDTCYIDPHEPNLSDDYSIFTENSSLETKLPLSGEEKDVDCKNFALALGQQLTNVKYQATLPDQLGTKDVFKSFQLPTLWENGENVDSEMSSAEKLDHIDCSHEKSTANITLLNEMKEIEMKRRLLRHRDSKLMHKKYVRTSLDSGDKPDKVLTYQDHGTQTIMSEVNL